MDLHQKDVPVKTESATSTKLQSMFLIVLNTVHL